MKIVSDNKKQHVWELHIKTEIQKTQFYHEISLENRDISVLQEKENEDGTNPYNF